VSPNGDLQQQGNDGELTGDSLARQFQQLEYKGSADQQLLELKQKMGMLPAGGTAEPRQLPTSKADDRVAEEAELVDEDDAAKGS